jgi:hypothetical protein
MEFAIALIQIRYRWKCRAEIRRWGASAMMYASRAEEKA